MDDQSKLVCFQMPHAYAYFGLLIFDSESSINIVSSGDLYLLGA